MAKKSKDDGSHRKSTPLWKWLVILLLVVAMPLYFSYYRMNNLSYILKNSAPAPVMLKKPDSPPNVHPNL